MVAAALVALVGSPSLAVLGPPMEAAAQVALVVHCRRGFSGEVFCCVYPNRRDQF